MKNNIKNDTMRPEYDFDYQNAVRGKYYQQLLTAGSNVVVLEPDIAEAFTDSASVNKELRYLLRASEAVKSKGGKVSVK